MIELSDNLVFGIIRSDGAEISKICIQFTRHVMITATWHQMSNRGKYGHCLGLLIRRLAEALLLQIWRQLKLVAPDHQQTPRGNSPAKITKKNEK